MYALVKPLLFALPPGSAHSFTMSALAPLEHFAALRRTMRARIEHPVELMGLRFPNRVGLAGGLDKNASRVRSFAAFGFGFLEVGTATREPQSANPSPNLFRLPQDRALINRLGFPNEGVEIIAARVKKAKGDAGIPIAISIGKSRSVGLEPIGPAIEDYRASFRVAAGVADFVVVNVSSPNTKDLRALQGAALARELLSALLEERRAMGSACPILVKIAPDLSNDELEGLLEVVEELDLSGVVATNTTIRREGLQSPNVEALGAGGLSGPPLLARALEVVALARKRLSAKRVIIGVGGISSATDARRMRDAGADLIQVYTALIYQGPEIVPALADALLA